MTPDVSMTCIHIRMQYVDTYEACIYDACMCDACQKWGRTNGKLNSRSRMIYHGVILRIHRKNCTPIYSPSAKMTRTTEKCL